MDDLYAVLHVKQGDIGRLEFPSTCHLERAFCTACLLTHDEVLAEDVVRDCFEHFFKGAPL